MEIQTTDGIFGFFFFAVKSSQCNTPIILFIANGQEQLVWKNCEYLLSTYNIIIKCIKYMFYLIKMY